MRRRLFFCGLFFYIAYFTCIAVGSDIKSSAPRPKVIVIGVNGAEWDIIRPLLLKGDMPNLARLIQSGVSGKLKTAPSPNCPKIYSILLTSTPTSENGISGFAVDGRTTHSGLLRTEALWKTLSDAGVTVGLANVPATFPTKPVNGYMISGMLTQGKNCDGILCSPKLSEVENGSAVFPKQLRQELLENVGDFHIDCSAMPNREDLTGHEAQYIDDWLSGVSRIRAEQSRLFEYLLGSHPTDFTMFVQSCEDRVGHWLYPIQPHNVGYNPKLNAVRVDAFPTQYREFDQLLGKLLKHLDGQTTLFVISDHGIKPLREEKPADSTHFHRGTTPIIAHHDLADGDDVPGVFIAMGPHIKKGVRISGFGMSVFDLAPTILSMYGLPIPPGMRGRVLSEIFEN